MSLVPNNEDIAGRFRMAKGMLKLDRIEFCEKYGFNRFTLKLWQMGRNNISMRMMVRFCDALRAEGIFCLPEWVLKGRGSIPIRIASMRDLPILLAENSLGEEEKLLQSEIYLFRENQIKLGRKPIVVEVSDNTMHPFLAKGDLLGGTLLPERSIDTLLGQIVIVAIGPDNYVVRRLMKDSANYLLIPSDYSEQAVSVSDIKHVAKINWHRTLK